MPKDASSGRLSPVLLEGSQQALHLGSTLQDLPLYDFRVDWTRGMQTIAPILEQHPLLPGVILLHQDEFIGMISRQRLLEFLLRPQGAKLFLRRPLQVLHSYAKLTPLLLPGDTSILTAAQQALRRSPEFLGEPIVVQTAPNHYYLLNIHQLNIAYWQIRGIETQVRFERLQVQMLQTEKMASLGRLVDGLAHEILDPVSFIWGNLSHIADYTADLMALVTAYEKYSPQIPPPVLQIQEAIELDYLREDLPKTLASIKSGADRLSKLANSLQNFCHIDEVYAKPADIHACLESVLLLLKSRLTTEIEIVKHYGPLPPISCFVGQLSQVLMNLLSRAIDSLLTQAIGDQLTAELKLSGGTPPPTSKPRITITTEVCSLDNTGSRWVAIRIADNGTPLSDESQKQLMAAFSNPHPLSKETSLTMSYRIITARHGGKFKVYSRIDPTRSQSPSSTEFEILLPLI